MKARNFKITIAVTFVLAIASIAAIILIRYHNVKGIEVIKTSYEIKTPLVSLTDADSIYQLDTQNDIWNQIEVLKEEKDYPFRDALIIENPFQTNTQSLYLYFTTVKPSSLEYTIHVEDAEIPDFTKTCYNKEENNLSTFHEYQLLGLIPDMVNEITLTITDASGKKERRSFTYQAPSLLGKENVKLDYDEGDSTQPLSDGLYTVFSGENFFYYYDNNGILRGEIPILNYRCLRLIFQNDKMYYSAGVADFAEMNSLGRLTGIYDLGTYNVHHDYTFDDNGKILMLGTDTTSERVEDRVLSLDPASGELKQVLDLTDLFPDYYGSCKPDKEGKLDWMHINTLQWLGNGTVLLSSRETSSILKINDILTNPTLEYMLGSQSFWDGTNYTSYLYNKAQDFKSQLGQHSITYVREDGLADTEYYLYLFDNNIGVSSTRPDYKWNSHFEDIGTVGEAQGEETSYYYKYLVNEATKTYELIDSFPVAYSGYMSSVQEIDSNIIVNSSNPKLYREYDQDHTLIRSFSTGSKKQAYRTYKYDFKHFLFD